MNEAVAKLLPYLDKLAEKIDTTGAVIWEALLRQAFVLCVSYIIQTIILTVFTYFFVKAYTKIKGDYDYLEVAYSIFAVVLAVVWIFAFFEITDVVTRLFNPEYWAIKEITKIFMK